MIIKNYEVEKVDLDKSNIILLYGENQGFKDEIVQKILKKKKKLKKFFQQGAICLCHLF